MTPDQTGNITPVRKPDASPWRKRLFPGCALILAMGAVYIFLWRTGYLETIMDSRKLHGLIKNTGAFGPLIIIGLFILAVVINPLPSAPIALAAGFAYGNTWGTIYTVTGSVAGAFIAFTIARLIGREILHRWFGDKLKVGLLGSQKSLMGLIFVFRLLPFISFDIVSYAAGLTDITWWRFLLATTAGIIPASFLLAHLGSEMGSGDMGRISVTVLLIGLITVIPLAVKVIIDRRRARSSDNTSVER